MFFLKFSQFEISFKNAYFKFPITFENYKINGIKLALFTLVLTMNKFWIWLIIHTKTFGKGSNGKFGEQIAKIHKYSNVEQRVKSRFSYNKNYLLNYKLLIIKICIEIKCKSPNKKNKSKKLCESIILMINLKNKNPKNKCIISKIYLKSEKNKK